MTSSSKYQNDIIYFDNAATSFPKPKQVIESVIHYMTRVGANPGRSGHPLSLEAGEMVLSAREEIAGLFGISNPMRVIFCSNATDALNLVIFGIVKEGDHVITTSMEHNSSIRPLKELESIGKISLSIINSISGNINILELNNEINPKTSLIIVNHASNAFGTVQQLTEIGSLCKDNKIKFVVDCAQSAGIIPVDINDENIDIIAFSGHKSLYGPTGTGGIVISDKFNTEDLKPLKFGGTGSMSDKIHQPDFLPDKYESGTLNVAGLNGLSAGVSYLKDYNYNGKIGIDAVKAYKDELTTYFLNNAIKSIEKFINYVPIDSIQTGVVSFNIEGIDPSKVSEILADDYKIMSRPGLHCAPLAHKSMGTFPDGTVRFGFGIFNTKKEIDKALEVLKLISRKRI